MNDFQLPLSVWQFCNFIRPTVLLSCKSKNDDSDTQFLNSCRFQDSPRFSAYRVFQDCKKRGHVLQILLFGLKLSTLNVSGQNHVKQMLQIRSSDELLLCMNLIRSRGEQVFCTNLNDVKTINALRKRMRSHLYDFENKMIRKQHTVTPVSHSSIGPSIICASW